MQRDRTISSRLLHLVGAFAAANGINFEELARECGIDLTAAKLPEGELQFSDFLNLLESASQRTGCEDFSVRLAATLPARLTGIYHYLTTNAATSSPTPTRPTSTIAADWAGSRLPSGMTRDAGCSLSISRSPP